MGGSGSKTEKYIPGKHVEKKICTYKSKYLIWNKCLYLTMKEYKEKIFLPKNFYYETGITTDIDAFVLNSLTNLSKELPNNKVPEPIYVLYAKKLEYTGTILGSCFEEAKNNIKEPISCKKNVDNYDIYKFIAVNIKNDEEKLKKSNMSKFEFVGNYDIYIYYPSLNPKKKYLTNYSSYLITNIWITQLISKSILYDILELDNILEEKRKQLKKVVIDNAKQDVIDSIDKANTEIIKSPIKNLYNYKNTILNFQNYVEEGNRNEKINNLLNSKTKTLLIDFINDDMKDLEFDKSTYTKNTLLDYLNEHIFTSLYNYRQEIFNKNDEPQKKLDREIILNDIINNSINEIKTYLKKDDFPKLEKYISELLLTNYTDTINKIIDDLKKNTINSNPLALENYNKCKIDGVVCDYSEDFDELLPPNTKDESQIENNIKAKSPFFPTKSLLTPYYEDNMFKTDNNFYDEIKKKIPDCVKKYMDNSSNIKSGNLKDGISKTEFLLIDELKKCYATYRNESSSEIQENNKYFYSKEYNKNILLELSKRNATYPGIQEIVFPVFRLDTNNKEIYNLILKLPWGDKLLNDKFFIDDNNYLLTIDKNVYSFNSYYSINLTKEGIIYVYNRYYNNIIYILNNKKINSSSVVENLVLDTLGSLILNIKNEDGQSVIFWTYKVFNTAKTSGPYVLIIDNNGYIKIYGDRFIEATDDDLYLRINKLKLSLENMNNQFELNNIEFNDENILNNNIPINTDSYLYSQKQDIVNKLK